MSLGPLMIDLAGVDLEPAEREMLRHPLVGGVILFSRNYQDRQQLLRLTAQLRALREPPLLIAIDHEGGRVQRCREGFTRLPPMRRLGQGWEQNAAEAIAAAEGIGFVLAAELREVGIDLSFAPVLDLDYGASTVIGDRAFHRHPQAVIALASALIEGMRKAGMAACGKHFPGHGYVPADSHLALPVDARSLAEMEEDLAPYRHLSLPAVMMAHVLYPVVDEWPASFSRRWVALLREHIGHRGVIFSDDLSMAGAASIGDVVARAQSAWEAGCDMLPVCNRPQDVVQLLDHWRPAKRPLPAMRLSPLYGKAVASALRQSPLYRRGVAACARLA
ncbi:MAG: beta-N-acetylhexosaminidase [Rhodocyclaceae bacterium]|nr:beta-N-acetylhexosaminidase [Rhodocyclaceae bacterium]